VEGIVVVDLSFKPVALDCGAEAILNDCDKHWGQPGNGDLPKEIRNKLSGQSGSDPDASCIRLNAGDHEYSCRAFTIRPAADGSAQPMLALHLKREVSMIDEVHRVGVDYRLTDREQEVLIGVSMGLSSKELATGMKISPNTVKAFLRLIMIKMGATNRAGIVGKLLGQNGHGVKYARARES
jgi:DNA-binding CsgD family transcriptional regulator